MPGAPSSDALVTSSTARSPERSFLFLAMIRLAVRHQNQASSQSHAGPWYST